MKLAFYNKHLDNCHMDLNQWLFVGILVLALYFFISEKLTVDLTALLIILSLAITGIISPKEALMGFSSEPALIVCAVFVLSAGLATTGLTDAIGAGVARLAGHNQWLGNAVIMLSTAILSAFTHHLMITAMMLPIVMRICRENSMPSSRYLIPMATAASLGTTMTLIGAPAFLLANNILIRSGEPSLRLFSVTPLGAMLVGSGILCILMLHWILPKTSGKDAHDEKFKINEIFTELVIPEESSWIGVSLPDFLKQTEKRFNVVGIKRFGQRISTLAPDVTLQKGDILLVKTSPDELISVDDKGVALRIVKKYGEAISIKEQNQEHAEAMIVQALVSPKSPFVDKTVGEIDFLNRFGVLAIGLWRKGGWIYNEISKVRLREGDMIILWGTEEKFDHIHEQNDFLLLFTMNLRPKRRMKSKVAAAIMLTSVALAATETLAPHIAFLSGAVAMVLTKCVNLRQAYESIEVRIFVMIAGVIPLGMAMEKTGLAQLMAEKLSVWTMGWDPLMMLLAFFTASALLTQILSDAATTVLIAPIAIAFAKKASFSPTAAVICVTVGAVASFLTPIGHHGNLLVLGPGNYRFVDFFKIGLPLTVLIAGLTCFYSLRFWG